MWRDWNCTCVLEFLRCLVFLLFLDRMEVVEKDDADDDKEEEEEDADMAGGDLVLS